MNGSKTIKNKDKVDIKNKKILLEVETVGLDHEVTFPAKKSIYIRFHKNVTKLASK